MAQLNEITCAQLSKLLVLHHINKKTLTSIQIKKRKELCIEQYFSVVKQFGHHPSTAELQKTYEGHYLSDKITRLWGTIHVFRKTLNISFNPRFRKQSNGVPLNRGPEALLFKNPPNIDRRAL